MRRKSYIDAKAEFDANPDYRDIVEAIVEREGLPNAPEVSAFLATDFVIRWIAYRDILPGGNP